MPLVTDRKLLGDQNNATGKCDNYLVLDDKEIAKGFVRPVRLSYVHKTCGTTTNMAQKLAETYARCPSFYGSTFCCTCNAHFPVGADGEFYWNDTSQSMVGT